MKIGKTVLGWGENVEKRENGDLGEQWLRDAASN